MTRAELIQMLVVNECCDDFEDIQQITKRIDKLGPKCGLTIAHEDIIQALRVSTERGWLKAWDLERWAERKTEKQREEITPMNPRFARTEEGLAFQKANSTSGPFDENHNLRQSWLTPEALSRHEELVRWLVFDSYRGTCTHVRLADIEMRCKGLAERYKISISRDEIIEALRELTRLGSLMAAYKDADCWQYDGMPPLEDIKPFRAYFWVTGDGWDYLKANEPWWPFNVDDDGEFRLREDWVPPNA
jgi:hypothetical protein